MAEHRTALIVGGGLTGPLLACLLQRQGWQVTVLEQRPDPRLHTAQAGKSINLALAERGLQALRQAGLDAAVLAGAVAMHGRRVHVPGVPEQFHAYSRRAGDAIWSIQRGRFNRLLLDAAQAAGAQLHFDTPLAGIDWARREVIAGDQRWPFDLLVGADGADSGVRRAMAEGGPLGERRERQPHGYKELNIPASGRLLADALHIWPRGGHMSIALPNIDGSFTTTLFLPHDDGSADCFAQLPDGPTARRWFDTHYSDLSAELPDLEADFEHNPIGQLGTLWLDRWHAQGCAVLVGDAAHPMVPFHGQGMNCGLEDVLALARHLARPQPLDAALQAYAEERRPNAGAIQAMALENYVEMRERVRAADYQLERQLAAWLEARHPGRFVPRYSMVTFSCLPYATAFARGEVQARLLREAVQGCERFEQIDLAKAERQLLDRLDPLHPLEGAA